MLHDRFYREWEQPTTVVASGAKLSALAKIRIEKDGRISDFKIVRSSGNVVVDDSVEAVGKKVTRVDAQSAVGTLDQLPELVATIDGGPAILIIGDVVAHSAPWRQSDLNQVISKLLDAAE